MQRFLGQFRTLLRPLPTLAFCFASALVAAAAETPGPAPAAAARQQTGSVLLNFDLSQQKEAEGKKLWRDAVERTKGAAERLGGACEVREIGEHQLRVVFFEHQERDLARVRRRLTGERMLEFRLVHPDFTYLQAPPPEETIPPGYEVMSLITVDASQKESRQFCLVKRIPEMTESSIARAAVLPDPFGGFAVSIQFTPAGVRKFSAVTGNNIDRQLGIVWDGQLRSAPFIRAAITTDSAQIGGRFSERQARELAAVLNTPPPLPVTLVVEP